jgi:putative NADH-flavin reductase
MKIALIGANGRVGRRLLEEARLRGHLVTAIVRDPARFAEPRAGVTWQQGDTAQPQTLAGRLRGHDVVISSTRFSSTTLEDLLAAVRASGVGRLQIVGGAGSLEIAPGQALLDSAEFPAAHHAEAAAGQALLQRLRQVTDIDWSFLSPSALFIEGQRTGIFQLGHDQLLRDRNGKSWISFEDYAVALLDETEHPTHPRQRFTVGY